MDDNSSYKKAVEKARREMQTLITVCKATGGYKYRERIRLSNKEIDRLMASCEQRLLDMAHRLVVAEMMLREPPPSIHPRWEEYLSKRADVMANLAKR